jgi:RNA polymerase sigma factor (sigma-70 family)
VAHVTRVGTETNLVLLGWTQDYLRTLLDQGAPDSVLAVAWDEFYRIYDDLMRRFAVARGLRGADVDDCLQAVWMDVASRLTDFERPAERPGLRSWLYTLVRCKVCDILSRNARRAAESLDEARDGGHEPADRGTDSRAVIDAEWHKALLGTLLEELRNDVSPLNWRLMQMRFVEGCDAAEIGAEVGLSPAEVRYRQSRLVKKLRTRAAALTGEPLAE